MKSRLEQMFEPEEPAAPLCSHPPRVWTQPDLGRGYGWIVRVGPDERGWYWTRWGAEHAAARIRATVQEV